jgi:hypothetical protein
MHFVHRPAELSSPNLMTRGSRGWTTVASEIHLTADPIERARGPTWSRIAPTSSSTSLPPRSADRHGPCGLETWRRLAMVQKSE